MRQLRKGRFSRSGSFYFVTTCCAGKRRLFVSPKTAAVIFDCLDWLEDQGRMAVWFCVVMPDHVHILFQLTGDKSLAEVMKSFKQYTGRRLRQVLLSPDPVWQRQYYDRMVRRDEDLRSIARYCWHNPVRAGLVEDPSAYPFWQSRVELV